MKVYVACHCRWTAQEGAAVLEAHGHTITSTWLLKPFNRTVSYTVDERRAIALTDCEEVHASDVLVLIAGPAKCAGGKFIEAGLALAWQKPIIIIGRRENMLLWHPAIVCVDTVEQAIKVLEHEHHTWTPPMRDHAVEHALGEFRAMCGRRDNNGMPVVEPRRDGHPARVDAHDADTGC